jgi:hypothetical protein
MPKEKQQQKQEQTNPKYKDDCVNKQCVKE